MTDEKEQELRRRLEQAGITQQTPQPQAPKTVRKVRGHTVAGFGVSGQPTTYDVEEMISNESGSELRNWTTTTKCKCGRVFHTPHDLKAECGVCGSSLCEECSKVTCRLDGKHLCIDCRLPIVEGVFICANHRGRSAGRATVARDNPVFSAMASSPMPILALPGPAPAPDSGIYLGSYAIVLCVGCGYDHPVDVRLGTQLVYCHCCDALTRVTFARDSSGQIQMTTDMARDRYRE